MHENFEVGLVTKINEKNEVEVNDFTRDDLLNKTFYGFSFYEMCCKPRTIKDVEKINFDFKKIDRIIKETLRCNICLQIYQEPVNMKNCLHKFCKKCIEEYNRRIKKECASCRHPIETRRLLREDSKIKEIINCLIPNIEKFNEVEDQIIKTFLPQLCFNDNYLLNSQNVNNKDLKDKYNNEKTQSRLKEYDQLEFNANFHKIFGRKRTRDNNTNEKISAAKFEDIWKNLDNSESTHKSKNLREIEVRLICDITNEDLKKAFNKSKIYSKENISLEYFARYICFKQDFKSNIADKFIFTTYDEENNKIELEKKFTLKEVMELSKTKENLVKLHFSLIN